MTQYMEPLPGHYDSSDPFGDKRPPRNPDGPGHLGSDYNGVDAGTWFHIVADGVVVYNHWHPILGWLLGVRKDDGKHVGYAHQLYQSPHDVGSRVSRGEWGGRVGNTGSASNGAHLHISLGTDVDAIWGGDVQDPHAYILDHLDATSGGNTTTESEDEMPIITPIIFDQHRPGHDDTNERLFGSTGIVVGDRFTLTSEGREDRGMYELCKVAFQSTVGPIRPGGDDNKDHHRDINALNAHLKIS